MEIKTDYLIIGSGLDDAFEERESIINEIQKNDYEILNANNDIETIACCDEELLNQVFKEGNLRIEITNEFFGGKLIDLEVAMEILKEASSFNIVGENIIEEAINCNLFPKESVRTIRGIPMAIKMMF